MGLKRIICLLIVGMLSSCDLSDEGYYTSFSISFDFSDSDEGWKGDFADYPEGDSVAYGLTFEHTFLPEELDETKKSLLISGDNFSDDLFMFIKKKITGFRPNTTYVVLFNVKVASNARTGADVAGETPGESVYLKVGAVPSEPKKVLDNGTYRMNIDKGNQSQGGDDMIVVGNVGVAANTSSFTVITRNNSSSLPFYATSNDQGELWLIVGTDSGFEGTTTLFYTSITTLFNEL